MTLEEQIFSQHAGKPVLVDANLLLLMMIGSFDPALITNFKRTSDYTIRDYEILVKFVGYFSGVVTTPHLLTEVSNLANSLPEWIKEPWSTHFQLQIPKLEERFQSSSNLSRESSFVRFGLADSALQYFASNSLVITNDRRIGGYLRAIGKPVLVFQDLVQISEWLEA